MNWICILYINASKRFYELLCSFPHRLAWTWVWLKLVAAENGWLQDSNWPTSSEPYRVISACHPVVLMTSFTVPESSPQLRQSQGNRPVTPLPHPRQLPSAWLPAGIVRSKTRAELWDDRQNGWLLSSGGKWQAAKHQMQLSRTNS